MGRKTRYAPHPTLYALQLVNFSLESKIDSKCAVGASASGMIKDVVEIKGLKTSDL